MSIETFTGPSMPALLTRLRQTLGPDARVVQVRRRGNEFELLAAPPGTSPSLAGLAPSFGTLLEQQMEQPMIVRGDADTDGRQQPAKRGRRGIRVIALVGPTGSGKTTTIAKLATHPEIFGGTRVGILGLDTYRVGAVEQLETYAELAGIPCEIAWLEADVRRAMQRLSDCDVILVDTPGRGPRQEGDLSRIRDWLHRLRPDEVHLTLAAGRMPAVTRATIDQFASFGVTHALPTKLDECPDDLRVFDVATERGLRIDWLTDGQEVPGDIRSAARESAESAARVTASSKRRMVAA